MRFGRSLIPYTCVIHTATFTRLLFSWYLSWKSMVVNSLENVTVFLFFADREVFIVHCLAWVHTTVGSSEHELVLWNIKTTEDPSIVGWTPTFSPVPEFVSPTTWWLEKLLSKIMWTSGKVSRMWCFELLQKSHQHSFFCGQVTLKYAYVSCLLPIKHDGHDQSVIGIFFPNICQDSHSWWWCDLLKMALFIWKMMII